MVPSFPEIQCEVMHNTVLAEDDDHAEVIPCAVVATTTIRGRVARSVVKIAPELDQDVGSDAELERIAYRGLHDSLRELANQQA